MSLNVIGSTDDIIKKKVQPSFNVNLADNVSTRI